MMSRRLSDDEKRVFSDQISLLKNENERLTKLLEEAEGTIASLQEESESEKKWSEIVLKERKKGNVVYLALDAVMIAPVAEIVKQPVDGLLWDLNRLEEVALTFMDDPANPTWVNNFAVALVIRELHGQVAALQAEVARLRGEILKANVQFGQIEADDLDEESE
jgi:uncharacterized small protein (DUF1192 family)